MAQAGTVDRILDAAEVLFAQKGFAETSLRAITSKAGVNLAAVNYHFGSKEALIQAVFERFLKPFSRALDAKLDEMETSGILDTPEYVLGIVFRLALGTHPDDPQRAAIFFRLSGQAYSQPQVHLREYLHKHYGAVFARLQRHLHQAVPGVSPMELFWRVQFSLGAVIFTLSGMQSLQSISKADFNVDASAADITRRLLSFLVGGIKADVPDLLSVDTKGSQ
ncbi:MAG: TetR family transcriptional regulator [Alcanivorax borkumensis]|jgi:AcrR family transcriptional regulator|uniref:Transcriptional regulator, TetR family n=1 Tax=Alcanivorax borkumensis (strain ATCC 700651 / DSM 11573 / NCIMB 13689 / SK2) TaxID=393595 RepID=Q0VQT4_ALCBS|nr:MULTISPECIES: TetR/AcrR family transcriptional regulator [Alcanivorax]OJH07004.1 MAG: TetR family transcriptional regulator [Alcanivorax borkumensis]EUC71543.1 TetR family transcriptional regulator [Alcanivorax sp. 97CO-5]PKG02968.1 TetR/AcrR family transcriptional regulator [Alcanivorax sp. 97CO-6]CAL16464.1 transcriptional regulator, TetR family [Alcanivorax borkumensis SK2]BAP13932.1 TetR family transcriptional regulator [Alcanivorax sp. NBRC 101098]